jgi:recombination protein RecR
MMSDSKSAYSKSVQRLLELFGRLPGVGARSAERMVFYVLKSSNEEALELAEAIRAVKEQVRHCSICHHLTETDPCAICADPNRDRGVICVVEQPKDLFQIEATRAFNGVYHVLLGRLAPLEGIGPENLTIADLIKRVQEKNAQGEPLVREVILATNPTVDGDGTALYIQEQLAGTGAAITRLARGMPPGAQIEHSNKAMLSDALTGRVKMR